MNWNIRTVVSLAILLFLAGFQSYAAELKIAVIDMDKVFQNYVRTKTVDATLKQQSEVYRSWIQKLNESMLKLEEQFKILRNDSQNIALSETDRETKRFEAQKKYREFQEKKLELEQYSQEKSLQLKELETKKREEILKEINQEVKRRATLDGYSLVLDASGKTLNAIPTIIYFQSSMDITETVLRDLNRGAAGK
ncbi:MAG: OmpH family outer membrane protein [Victivallaceae bacterium]|jgi:Skp family chaperone for outer membrane proteins|nr:OmpH family outer membrane protein [Victivallaceae bacterium]NLK84114.1 OmpH family outer membrane protein [Lentisphaerota bacterium]MDD3116163.1 OmpH family outer membrane protein [Victivallaceae bacterium]MDD3702967.1 OmpH family outer membrane protein [Victivallaceae bacterium]MDD4317428.1 OmpH family outer membrane protein [Victivallaceae bacterium]